MNNLNCEEFLMQKIALLDGEKADLPPAEIDAHLAVCGDCRRESERMENTLSLLKRHERRAPAADLWPAIETRIGAAAGPVFTVGWRPFALVGALLLAYRLLEMLPARDFGWALKLVPFVLAGALFLFLKENPFKINTEMILEK